MTKFRRLSITHAAMMGGDAAMLVALADSLFLSIDPSAARTRVLLFLLISFAPFLFIAPLIGPAIDRAAGGRRTVIQIVAAARVVLAVLMALSIDELTLFPLVFAALVLQKTYLVSKQALVPSVVRTEADLVEANSKLGVIAGLTGFVAVIPAALLQVTPLAGWGTLLYSGALFGVALASATRLPADVVAARPEQPAERVQLHSIGVQLAAMAMLMLRAAVGFVFFHLAFWLRDQSAGTAWFAVAIGMSALAIMAGNAIAPRLRRAVREERDARRRARPVDGSRVARRLHRRRGGRRRPRRGGQLRRRGRPPRLREHRPARRATGEPRPCLRPLRDPLPAGVGRGRPDPGASSRSPAGSGSSSSG